MFAILKNNTYRVHAARTGRKQDGSPYALITLLERENQPVGMERPSNSSYTVKMWFDRMPKSVEGIKDGSLIRLIDFDGTYELHEENGTDRSGNKKFRDSTQVINAVLELV